MLGIFVIKSFSNDFSCCWSSLIFRDLRVEFQRAFSNKRYLQSFPFANAKFDLKPYLSFNSIWKTEALVVSL